MDGKFDSDLIYKILVAVFGSGGVGAVLVAVWQRKRASRRIEIETPLKVIAAGAAATVTMNQAEMARMAERILRLEARRDEQDERIELLEEQHRECEERGRELERRATDLESQLADIRGQVNGGASRTRSNSDE